MPKDQITLTPPSGQGPFETDRPLFPLSPEDIRALLLRRD